MPCIIKYYSAVGCQSKEVEYVKVARQVSDKRNLGRVRADIIFQPALGITSLHSYLLITSDLFSFK